MKKFKISILCVLLSVLLGISSVAVTGMTKEGEVFQTETSYMTSENLALNNKNEQSKKATDGKMSTVFNSFRKKGYIEIDLGQEETFNAVVLKEKGLNIKKFSVLVSDDNESFRPIYRGDKIEYHRLCTFDDVTARYVRLFVNESDAFYKIREIEIYSQPQTDGDNFRTAGYIVSDSFNEILNDESIADKETAMKEMLEKYNFKGITDVYFYCGVSYDENGNVFVGNREEDVQKQLSDFKFMLDCMRKYGKENLKISFVIASGSGNAVFNSALDKNRALFIRNIISFANEYGFNGVDFDYEFPQSDYDFTVFGDFLVELKAKMIKSMRDKENSILSCAFGTRDINYPQKVVDAIDIVNMMTYDIFDQDGQHSSFWSCAVQGAKYLEKVGFKKEQINIGIPFYGTQVDALMEQYVYKNIGALDYFENTYIMNSYFDASPTEVYFNSPAMVRDKTAYALLNGYGGIMVWHFSCDADYSSDCSLWRSIYTAVKQFGGEEQ